MRFLIETFLLIGIGIAFFYVYRRQSALIALARREREEIRLEESRVFDFLHSLGEAFSDDIRTADLHRLIVESAVRILEAQGGALYLVDKTGAKLMPAFISKSCPPLVEVPPHIVQQVSSAPQALESYVRLHAVQKNEGILGSVLATREPVFIINNESDPRLAHLRDTTLHTSAILVVPMVYRNQILGVLAVANGAMATAFSEADFDVFKSIAEQSAFALYNALVYYEASEKKRLDRDLHIARDIQRILLPSSSPQIEGFEICGLNIPAKQVSGDYFDYIPVNEQQTGIAIADVSGKGIPASLIMAMCRSVLRSQAPSNASPADVLHKVNRQLFPDIKEDMFISMAYLLLTQGSNHVTLSRAGHDAPMLYRAKDKSVERLNPRGMALGIDSGSVFDRVTADFEFDLETGDCIVLYTDGVTEALDERSLEFGMEKMILAIQASAPEGAAAVLRRLTDELTEFSGTQPQNDDITLIAIRKI
ncbi:MAG TPA: GAF domain-containing SpoIIE family protein phosphatase [Chthoniobacterales bacterium]|jgi:sigma-B regulation protein RsbU (phosphoserine phosphatase)